jgi:hypothetical protein
MQSECHILDMDSFLQSQKHAIVLLTNDRMSWFKMPFRAEIVTNPYNIEWGKVFIKNVLLSHAFHKNNNVTYV